jgi:hypothetical protein
MGRPKKDIDEGLVFRLSQIHCTLGEMASVVGCSEDTLQRRFADVIRRGKDQGKASLRRLQFRAARKGNPLMLKFLGQQILGQSDKSESLNIGLTHQLDEELKSPAEALRELREKIDSFRNGQEKGQAAPEAKAKKPRPNVGPPRIAQPVR